MMKKQSYAMMCCAICAILGWAPVQGQVMIDKTAEWILSWADPCPSQWRVIPPVPSSSQSIAFEGPTSIFNNGCEAESYFGGEPALFTDWSRRTVELIFLKPAPIVCPLLLAPVCGLKGTFGPLAPGTWTFKCVHPDLTFSLKIHVDGVVTGRDVIYVDGGSLSLNQDGTSWGTAYLTLDQAFAVAEQGSRIRVAKGTYRPAPTGLSRRHATFQIPSGVTLEGGYRGIEYWVVDAAAMQGPPWGDGTGTRNATPVEGPNDRDIDLFETRLSGDLQGPDLRDDNAYHVVTASWVGEGTVIDGFTLCGGPANGLGPHESEGGGLLVNGGVLTVRRCRFLQNAAMAGGAVKTVNSWATFSHCLFEDNLALMHGGALSHFGGFPRMLNCLLVGNRVPGDTYLGGSALSNTTTDLELLNCTLADNEAMSGGAITCFGGTL